MLVGRFILRPDGAQQHMALILEPGPLFQLGGIGTDSQPAAALFMGLQGQAGVQHHHLGAAGLQRVQIQLLDLGEGEQQLRQLAQHLAEGIDIESFRTGLLADLATLERPYDLVACQRLVEWRQGSHHLLRLGP